MTKKLPKRVAERRTGAECFSQGSVELPLTLQDFWCWSTSDLLNNTTRGVLAEFLVATALQVSTSGVRDPWAAYDLETSDGIRIEVKSSAYLQAWAQKRPSTIVFNVPKTRAWSADTNELAKERVRQAHVYVFALLHHELKETVNPLDLSQWFFFVLPTATLAARTRSQHSITLKTLQSLSGGPVTFDRLGTAVRAASAESSR